MPHVTFIHGISNKPEREALRNLWLRSLARENGFDCDAEGVTTSMVYWADVMYASPLADVEAFESANDLLEAQTEAEPGMAALEPAWRAQLSPEQRSFVQDMAHRLGADLPEEVAPPQETSRGRSAADAPPLSAREIEAVAVLERVPLPWFIKKPLMSLLLRDVHHYLFNTRHTPRPGEAFAVQEEIRRRFVQAVSEGATQDGPHIVVSHSMGTVIAYDCLKRVQECPAVDALVTIGSPLGLDEIQDRMAPEWTRRDGFPAKVRGPWINVYDPLDPVAGFDPKFANDYLRGGGPVVEDIEEPNWGRWRHSITKYLFGPKLRGRFRELFA